MCYDVSAQLRSKIKYAKHIGATEEDIADLERQLANFDWKPQYRVDGFSPSRPKIPVVTDEKPNQIQLFEWRFLSDSVVKSKRFLNTLNAKSETLFDSWTYKQAAQSRHCIVLVDGFFEPHGYGKQKKSVRHGREIIDYTKKAYYYIEARDDEPLSLAGLWNSWVDKETGEVHDTFTIITVPASPLMKRIHNVAQRMPAVLPKELQRDWITVTNESSDLIQKQKSMALLQPYDDALLKYRTVYNIKKKDAADNAPEVLEKYEYTNDEEFSEI